MALYEYDLFLPFSKKRLNKPIAKILSKARKEIVQFFGGLTESPRNNKGRWKVGPLVVNDDIQVWSVLSDKGIRGDSFLKKLKRRLERDLKQDLILVIRRKVSAL